MDDLIAALTIFAKYQEPTQWPTICAHDQLMIVGVTADQMSAADRAEVEELGFVWSDGPDDAWISFRFGSA